MLFQPHWKLDGVGHAFEPFRHHDRDLEPGQMDAEAEVLPPPEGEQPLDRPVPHELVGFGVLTFVAVGGCEQRDDPLARFDRGAVDRARRAHSRQDPHARR